MKEVFVKDLRKDQEITDFFMAKTLAIKVAPTGNSISIFCWPISREKFPAKNGM